MLSHRPRPASFRQLAAASLAPDTRWGVVVPQGLDGAPRDDTTHPCTSWCSEQLAAFQLELAELRDQVAALRRDGRVGTEARPSVKSEPSAQPTDSGDDVVGPHGRSAETRSGLSLLPRPSVAQVATTSSIERAESPAPLKRALLQTAASSPSARESALPCNKNEVGNVVAADDQERLAVFMKLRSTNPLCAACIAPCVLKPRLEILLCLYACHHQRENACNTTTGWERARPLLHKVDLRSRDSLIHLMAVVQPPHATITRPHD
jgi:hypothetical protein